MHSTDRTTPGVTAPVPAQDAGPGSRPGPSAIFEGPGTAPVLLHRRDGILPAVAAALSVRGETTTRAGTKAETPPRLHPLVDDFLTALPPERRERWAGRCPEAVLLSQFLLVVDGRRSKRAARKPMSHGDARKALKHAKLTARRIREDGDPEHGAYSPPCRSCAPLLAHFGVRAVDPDREAR